MQRTHLIAILVGLATMGIFATDASAYYNPGRGRFLSRDPGPGGTMGASRIGTAGAAIGGGFLSSNPINTGNQPNMAFTQPPYSAYQRVGQISPSAYAGTVQIGGVPINHQLLGRMIDREHLGNTGYVDGPNLYQYVRSNPVQWQDPKGTNIYLKTGNDTWNPVNNAIHQNVCVDTCENGQKGVTCFSYAANGMMFRFGGRRTWLGWSSNTLGGVTMKGIIYETEDTGKVVKTKITNPTQDQVWLNWMRRFRVKKEDVYSIGRHNCRTYSQWEFRDAP